MVQVPSRVSQSRAGRQTAWRVSGAQEAERVHSMRRHRETAIEMCGSSVRAVWPSPALAAPTAGAVDERHCSDTGAPACFRLRSGPLVVDITSWSCWTP
eukprot:597257-Rhodomonas_salina.1